MIRFLSVITSEFVTFIEVIYKFMPGRLGLLTRRYIYRFFLLAGTNLKISTGVTIKGFSNIIVGNNVSIMRQSYLYSTNASLKIGDNFTMNSNSYLSADDGLIHIGNSVMIAQNVVVRAADHNHDSVDIPIQNQGVKYGEIHIEDGVWVCANSVITSNTRIGKHSIVAAGSVVTKDVPPYSIVAGVPAKIIKRRESLIT